MANYQLTAGTRTETGKSFARKLRVEEKIPAVVYGSGKPALTLVVSVREAEKALASHGSLIDLVMDEGNKTVIVKDIHREPVKGTLLHLDFHEIDLSKKLEITVPIRVSGEEARANDGGVVTTLLWEVTVSCLPTDIPEAIDVDVSALGLDQVISVAELQLPSGIEVLDEASEAVVKVDVPTLEVEAGEEDEADGEIAETAEEAEEAEED